MDRGRVVWGPVVSGRIEIVSIKFIVSISGIRFRRQHWCLLSVILLIIVLSVAIGLPLSGDDLPMTAEERAAVVKQLLKEVPLIDG